MKIYTKKGDQGTTGLLFGGRVVKNDPRPEACGAVDEAVAHLGIARAMADSPLAERILEVQRALFVCAAELATLPDNRSKLEPDVSLVTEAMVEKLERLIDEMVEENPLPDYFVVPGDNALSAQLDVARATVRRAERRSVAVVPESSQGVPYLNRLSDYLFVLARSVEAAPTPSRPDT